MILQGTQGTVHEFAKRGRHQQNPSHFSSTQKYVFRLFTIEINLAIGNNLKPTEIKKIQCETIYPTKFTNVFPIIYEDFSFLNIYGQCERIMIADDLI